MINSNNLIRNPSIQKRSLFSIINFKFSKITLPALSVKILTKNYFANLALDFIDSIWLVLPLFIQSRLFYFFLLIFPESILIWIDHIELFLVAKYESTYPYYRTLKRLPSELMQILIMGTLLSLKPFDLLSCYKIPKANHTVI